MWDLTGQEFGRLKVIEFSHSERKGERLHHYWKCKCSCGNEKIAKHKYLIQGNIKSCGCLKEETNHINLKLDRRKNHAKIRIRNIYNHMKSRCLNPNDPAYMNYGGRGIKICDEWLRKFDNFYFWCMANGQAKGLTLDRIDNDGNYEPSNCRFVDRYVQNNNTRANRYITYKDETKTVTQWSRILGIKEGTLNHRLKKGWSIEKAFFTPVRS